MYIPQCIIDHGMDIDSRYTTKQINDALKFDGVSFTTFLNKYELNDQEEYDSLKFEIRKNERGRPCKTYLLRDIVKASNDYAVNITTEHQNYLNQTDRLIERSHNEWRDLQRQIEALEISLKKSKRLAKKALHDIYEKQIPKLRAFEDSVIKALNEFSLSSPPKQHGVYVLMKSGRPIYVGQSTDLPSRIKAHKRDKDFDAVSILDCDKERLLELESVMISFLKPPLNKIGGFDRRDVISKRHRSIGYLCSDFAGKRFSSLEELTYE